MEFAFHSMVDLGRYDDGSFDLVYSGQSIEHVSEADGDAVVREAFRVLVPGGWFCLDTPNGPLWRLRSDAPMNHDHKIEYAAGELVAKLERAGFEVAECKGLNLMRRGAAAGVFDEAEASAHPGVFAAAEECLLLALVARKAAGADLSASPYGVVVAMMVLGTSSTQVWPGCSGIGTPKALTNWVGDPSVERCQVPGMAEPLR